MTFVERTRGRAIIFREGTSLEVEGVYRGRTDRKTNKGTTIHLLDVDGEEKELWGTYAIDEALSDEDVGRAVKITYDGTVRTTRSGNTVKPIRVFVDEGAQ